MNTQTLTAEQAQRELRKMFVDLNERMWNGFNPQEDDWLQIFDEACEIVEPLTYGSHGLHKLNQKFVRILSIYPNSGQRHIVSCILQGQFERKLRRQIKVCKIKALEAELESRGEVG